MTRFYIGLANTQHDPALAIVDEQGQVVFAEAAERYLQNKRAWNCVPDHPHYIKQLLHEHVTAGSELVLAYSWSDKFKRNSNYIRKVLPLLRKLLPPVQYDVTDLLVKGQVASQMLSGLNINRTLNVDFSRIAEMTQRPVTLLERRYDHHLCHAAYACLASNFEHAVCAVADGIGENSSYAFYQFVNGKLTPLAHCKQHPLSRLRQSLGIFTTQQSLGVFYSTLSEICGFDSYSGEEWKMMGLAAYGKHDKALYQRLRQLFTVRDVYVGKGRDFVAIMKELVAKSRKPGQDVMAFADLAATGHQVFCDVFTELLNQLHSAYPADNLVLAGGCALNSAFTGEIVERTPFQRLYIPSAPGDDGNCIGAALLAYQQDHPHFTGNADTVLTPYLGAEIKRCAVDRLSQHGKLRNSLPATKTVHRHTAELLAAGKIVGWVQGRAEFGPRALGNRSILADPRAPGIKERINQVVKFREAFRPFAPSILHEQGPAYFENYQASPYMDRALRFRVEVIDKVPGVVHVDGTGRLQSVKESWNPDYYRLITEFYHLTGIPLILNTSFNVMGKPIVHGLEDCIAVFFTTGLDALVIGDRVFEKDVCTAHPQSPKAQGAERSESSGLDHQLA